MKQETNPHPHELLSAFSDQVATPEEAARLQEHLRDCAECRQLLHDLTALATAIGEEAVPAPPPQLAARIRQRIEAGSSARTTPAPASFWRSPYPPALAATLLMATTLFLIWRRENVAPPAGQAPLPSAPVAKSQAGPVSDKLAGPPPAPSTEKSDIAKNEVVDQKLKSLGYSGKDTERSAPEEGSPKTAADAAAANAFSPAPKHDRQEASAYGRAIAEPSPSPDSEEKSRDYLEVITASGLTGEDYKKAMAKKTHDEVPRAKDNRASAPPEGMAGGAVKESDQVVSAEEARSLAYEGPAFSATFSEDGLLTLVTRGYACSVTVPPSQAAPDGAPSRPIEDLASLFRTASSREFLSAGSTREDAPTAMAAPAAPATSSLALRNAEGDPIHSVPFNEPLSQESPQILRTLNQGIRLLIQQRYRKELETRCGPLPAALLPAP